jgi:hypothetical protein
MSLHGGRDLLYNALKTLQAHWDNTDPYWQDAMKQQFVEQILTPLQDHTAAGLGAIDQMEAILTQMRLDCEGNQFDIFGSSEDDE